MPSSVTGALREGRYRLKPVKLDLADTLIALGGIALVAGAALIHLAAAVILGGLELVLVGIALARRGPHGTSG